MTSKYDQLRKEFPEFYSNISFDCGEGWYDLIRELSIGIRSHIKDCSSCHFQMPGSLMYTESPFYPTQIKEKYGYLCYYISNGCYSIFDLIHKAEDKSSTICEKCGADARSRNLSENDRNGGWIYTRCNKCYAELEDMKKAFYNGIRQDK